MDWYEKYIDKPWNWGICGLSEHENLTIEWIEKHIDKPWNWGKRGLSFNGCITLEFIKKHPDKPWYWGEGGLSSNPSLKPEWIAKYPEKPWGWGTYGISSNSGLTIEMVEKFRDKPWNWKCIRFLNKFSIDYDYEYVKYYKSVHYETLKHVLDEYMSVCFHPDNMPYMVFLGVYPDGLNERWEIPDSTTTGL